MANQVVTIIDNNGNDIYPVAGALMQGAVTTSTINDGAVTANKIDFSTFGDQTNYFDIGNIRVAFGTNTLNNVPSSTDTQSSAISYGTTFASPPSVTVSVNVWVSLVFVLVSSHTTTDFKVVIKHNQGATVNIEYSWMAIGLKPTA